MRFLGIDKFIFMFIKFNPRKLSVYFSNIFYSLNNLMNTRVFVFVFVWSNEFVYEFMCVQVFVACCRGLNVPNINIKLSINTNAHEVNISLSMNKNVRNIQRKLSRPKLSKHKYRALYS